LFALTILGLVGFLYLHTSKELAPEEDQGIVFAVTKAPKYANIDYIDYYGEKLDKIFGGFPETDLRFVLNGINGPQNGIAGNRTRRRSFSAHTHDKGSFFSQDATVTRTPLPSHAAISAVPTSDAKCAILSRHYKCAIFRIRRSTSRVRFERIDANDIRLAGSEHGDAGLRARSRLHHADARSVQGHPARP